MRKPELKDRTQILPPRPAVSMRLMKIMPLHTYRGLESENFRSWWKQVERYLDYHMEQIPTDRYKIKWITLRLGECTLRWYEYRNDKLERLHMVETREGFSTAMRVHFVNPYTIKEDLAKMDKLMYPTNINDYIIMQRRMYPSHQPHRPLHQHRNPRGLLNLHAAGRQLRKATNAESSETPAWRN